MTPAAAPLASDGVVIEAQGSRVRFTHGGGTTWLTRETASKFAESLERNADEVSRAYAAALRRAVASIETERAA